MSNNFNQEELFEVLSDETAENLSGGVSFNWSFSDTVEQTDEIDLENLPPGLIIVEEGENENEGSSPSFEIYLG